MDATAEADEAQTAARVEMPPNDRGGDHLSRAQVRTLVEYVLAGKLGDREISPADYDHLVDAVMRLRGWARIGPKRPPRCVICAD